MISQKNLNLDRKRMEEDLETNAKIFFDESATVAIKNCGQNKIFEITANSVTYKISAYYLSNGTTSLCSAGSPNTHDKTDPFIHKISQDYSFSDKKSISFSIPSIDDETYKILLEYFDSDINASRIIERKESVYELIQYKGHTDDLLTIKRYTNGNTQFQGKPLVLYTHLCEFLSGLCSAKEIIDAQQEIYQIEINEQESEREFDSCFLRSKEFLKNELKEIILPAFSLRNIEIQLTDYSLFVFPILKGLEGYIRAIFKHFGITTDSRDHSIGSFFTLVMSNYELNADARNRITDKNVQRSLSKLYNQLKKERNSIFHVDGGIVNTRIVETREEADSIIKDTIDLIESTYIDMNL